MKPNGELDERRCAKMFLSDRFIGLFFPNKLAPQIALFKFCEELKVFHKGQV